MWPWDNVLVINGEIRQYKTEEAEATRQSELSIYYSGAGLLTGIGVA